MRNIFLILVLANLLLLAWQFWIDPAPPVVPTTESGNLVLFGPDRGSSGGGAVASDAGEAARKPRPSAVAGSCFRLGPLADITAAQQAREQLVARGIDATPIARETQVWLGHWVQIAGFASTGDAEAARQRLVAGGVADAYLMQDGAQPMVSLGVFRDRTRANRVAGAAGRLGFQATMRDRYRPTVEQWLLISPRPDQTLGPADLSLAGDRILRSEPTPCTAAVAPFPPAGNLPAAGQPQ